MALEGMRLACVFRSMYAPLKPCVKNVGSMSHSSSQHKIGQYAIRKRKACNYSAHAFLPILFGVCAAIIVFVSVVILIVVGTATLIVTAIIIVIICVVLVIVVIVVVVVVINILVTVAMMMMS